MAGPDPPAGPKPFKRYCTGSLRRGEGPAIHQNGMALLQRKMDARVFHGRPGDPAMPRLRRACGLGPPKLLAKAASRDLYRDLSVEKAGRRALQQRTPVVMGPGSRSLTLACPGRRGDFTPTAPARRRSSRPRWRCRRPRRRSRSAGPFPGRAAPGRAC